MRALLLTVGVPLITLGGGPFILACGAGGVEHPPATSEDFAFIARQEAVLAAASGDECEEDTVESSCDAAQAICQVARGTRDRDARARCASAERQCGAIRSRCD